MSDVVTRLSAYRCADGEGEWEDITEPALAVLWTESEVRALERAGEALLRVGSPDASTLLAKVLLWRALRKSGGAA
jgi:serine/threonine-protein kinase RIO1